MKKRLTKFLFIFISITFLFTKVDARVVNNLTYCNGNASVSMGSITPAGWDTYLNVCTPGPKVGEAIACEADSAAATMTCCNKVYYNAGNGGGKDSNPTGGGTYKLCDTSSCPGKGGYVQPFVRYSGTYTKSATPVYKYVPVKCEDENQTGCTKKEVDYYTCDCGTRNGAICEGCPCTGTEKNGDPGCEDAKPEPDKDTACMNACKKNSGWNYNISSCEQKYGYYYPIYKCVETPQLITNWCNRQFKITDKNLGLSDTAYCINPSMPNATDYIDTGFDATKCISSYSTIECGYANILIEAAWHNQNKNARITDETMLMALRLWGSYSGQAGYDGVGLALQMGAGCGERAVYTQNNPNVYAVNQKLVFEAIGSKNIDKALADLSASNLVSNGIPTFACSPGTLGQVCAASNSNYVQAFALFIGTIKGNENMMDHLSQLYGGLNTEPLKVGIESDGSCKTEYEKMVLLDKESEEYKKAKEAYDKCAANTTTYVKADYNEEITTNNIKVYCDDASIQKLINEGVLTDTAARKVKSYCGNTISLSASNTETTYTDALGREIYDFDYCQKNSCYAKVKYFVPCVQTKTPKATVEYTSNSSKTSVKIYEACSGGSNHQIMVTYYDDPNSNNDKRDTSEYTIDLKCDSIGGCNDYDLRTNNKNKNPINGENKGNVCVDSDNADEGNTYERYIKDPSLSCILNMDSIAKKEYYNYAEYYGVNPSICGIYCSDEVHYEFANAVTAYAGKSFVYDIKPGGYKNSSITQKLSSSIKEVRNCVSEIYYDNGSYSSIEYLAQAYNVYDDMIGKKDFNWKNLYDALATKSGSEGNRKEVLNQLVYDLYNCNLYKNITAATKPKDVKVTNVYNNINAMYKAENNYGYQDCVLNEKTNTCLNISSINYMGGATYLSDESNHTGQYSGDIGVNYTLKNNKQPVVNVGYCSGDNCFKYEKSINKSTENYSMPADSGTKTATSNGFTYPTNDYAFFTISTEVDFYNESRFETQAYTGLVQKKAKADNTTNFAPLDAYVFPLSSTAREDIHGAGTIPSSLYATKENGNRETCLRINGNTSRCFVEQEVSALATYYRKQKNDDYTNAVTGRNNAYGDFTKFYCYVNVLDSGPRTTIEDPRDPDLGNGVVETYYRNIDISDIFPGFTTTTTDVITDETVSETTSRDAGKNWKTDAAMDYVKEVEQYVADNGQMEYYDTHLEYSYDLTPEIMQNIRNYNSDIAKGNYLNYTLHDCELKDGLFFNCTSTFITELNNNRYGEAKIKGSGVSEYTCSKEKLNDPGCQEVVNR